MKNASSRFTWTASGQHAKHHAPTPALTSDGRRDQRDTRIAATIAWSRLLTGPAAAMMAKSRCGWRRLRVSTGTGFAQPMSGRWLTDRQERQEDRADQIDVDQRIERHAAQTARRRIAEPVGGQGVRRFVNGERDQQHTEADGDAQEIDVGQGAVTAGDVREKGGRVGRPDV